MSSNQEMPEGQKVPNQDTSNQKMFMDPNKGVSNQAVPIVHDLSVQVPTSTRWFSFFRGWQCKCEKCLASKSLPEKASGKLVNAHKFGQFDVGEDGGCHCDKTACFAYRISNLEVKMVKSVSRSIGNIFCDYFVRRVFKREGSIKLDREQFDLIKKLINLNDTTHNCVQIDFQCLKCLVAFSMTYEVSSHGKYAFYGTYKNVLNCYDEVEGLEIPYSEVKAIYGNMWFNYKLESRNCKYWGVSFYTRLTINDPFVIKVQDFLDLIPSLVSEEFEERTETEIYAYLCYLNFQKYHFFIPEETKEMLCNIFSIMNEKILNFSDKANIFILHVMINLSITFLNYFEYFETIPREISEEELFDTLLSFSLFYHNLLKNTLDFFENNDLTEENIKGKFIEFLQTMYAFYVETQNSNCNLGVDLDLTSRIETLEGYLKTNKIEFEPYS